MTAPAAGVVAEGVGYAFGRRTVLHDIDLAVAAGERFGVLGPNGSGKSTLFRLVTTQLALQTGSLRVGGLDGGKDPAGVRRLLGVVFQSPAVDPHLTVRENLHHHGHLYDLGGNGLERRATELLERFGLAGRAHERVRTLSGGLRRRLELAKALLPKPRVLVLDEPSTGLDPGARRDLDAALAEAAGAGVAILLTTHLGEEAERCDRLLLLDRGHVVATGPPEALRSAVGGDVVCLETGDAEAVAAAIRSRWGNAAAPVVRAGEVRFEHAGAHTLVPELVGLVPGAVRSLTVRRPTLEDVFLHHTGHTFWEGAP